MFEIEKDVPVPETHRRGASGIKYPLREMEVGDSFLVPCENGDTEKARGSVNGYLTREKRLTGKKFCTRKVDGGVRVWRYE